MCCIDTCSCMYTHYVICVYTGMYTTKFMLLVPSGSLSSKLRSIHICSVAVNCCKHFIFMDIYVQHICIIRVQKEREPVDCGVVYKEESSILRSSTLVTTHFTKQLLLIIKSRFLNHSHPLPIAVWRTTRILKCREFSNCS
jgi:hypothetical protein